MIKKPGEQRALHPGPEELRAVPPTGSGQSQGKLIFQVLAGMAWPRLAEPRPGSENKAGK